MTHPLTPREKVAQIVRNGMNRLAASQAGSRPVVSASKEADRVTDAILTALASGSGDHAELTLNAKAAQSWALGIYENRQQAERRSKFIDSDLPATVLALLAENAALRAERDGMIEEVSRSQARLHAATEAERKLAEAVGHVEQLVDRLHSIRDSSIVLIAARTFLSKEAGRG